MKINGKTTMISIVMVMALAFLLSGCAPAFNSKTPGFLEVGGYYEVETVDDEWHDIVVLEIKNDGWILADGFSWDREKEKIITVYFEESFWLNTAQLITVRKLEKPE